jgi:hypothetical protein
MFHHPVTVRSASSERRPIVIVKLRALTEELKGWPPEVAEELAPLVLQTFQEE